MTDEPATKSWFQSLPGILTALAATVTAVAGLVAAIPPVWQAVFGTKTGPANYQNCISGYVWREATPEDHVCVTMETHLRTLQDNQLAGSRRNASGGTYGADTCMQGYVW